MLRTRMALLCALAVGCGGAPEDGDDGDGGSGVTPPWGDQGDGGDDEEDEWEPCEETWVDYVGPDDPVVGDEWTIWLRCDGAILTGPTVIRFDPLDFATVSENVITFARTGEGMIFVQTGTESAELDLLVGD